MRAALLQLGFRDGEPAAARVDRVLHLLASAPGADLLVLPELWDVGYFAFDDYAATAAPLDAGAAAAARDACAGRGAVLVAGSVVERDGDRLHNTVAVFDADGTLAGRYRKRNLFAYGSREAEVLTPGAGASAIGTAAGRLGVATCFDLRFPEHFAELRDADVDVFVVPAAWPAARRQHWTTLVDARAIECQTPVLAVNGAGPCSGVELAGCTRAVDARGTVLAEAGATDVDRWILCDVDPEDTDEWRTEFPMRPRAAHEPGTSPPASEGPPGA